MQFHEDRINAWISKGAIVTDAVKKIQKLHKKGGAVSKPAPQPKTVRTKAAASEADTTPAPAA